MLDQLWNGGEARSFETVLILPEKVVIEIVISLKPGLELSCSSSISSFHPADARLNSM